MQNTITIKIPFFDVDSMDVVWHGNYIKYFEMGRCAFLEEHDLSYPKLYEMGIGVPIINFEVKYIKPCYFAEEIKLTTTLVPSENMLIFKYLITDLKTGEKLCKAQSRQMAVDMKTKEGLFYLPEVLMNLMTEEE